MEDLKRVKKEDLTSFANGVSQLHKATFELNKIWLKNDINQDAFNQFENYPFESSFDWIVQKVEDYKEEVLKEVNKEFKRRVKEERKIKLVNSLGLNQYTTFQYWELSFKDVYSKQLTYNDIKGDRTVSLYFNDKNEIISIDFLQGLDWNIGEFNFHKESILLKMYKHCKNVNPEYTNIQAIERVLNCWEILSLDLNYTINFKNK